MLGKVFCRIHFSSFEVKDAMRCLGLSNLEKWKIDFKPLKPSDFYHERVKRLEEYFDLNSTERAKELLIEATFEDAERFLLLPGVRRALVAYWQDVLSAMRQNSSKSLFARFHNYDAVQALVDYKRARKAAEYLTPNAILISAQSVTTPPSPPTRQSPRLT